MCKYRCVIQGVETLFVCQQIDFWSYSDSAVFVFPTLLANFKNPIQNHSFTLFWTYKCSSQALEKFKIPISGRPMFIEQPRMLNVEDKSFNNNSIATINTYLYALSVYHKYKVCNQLHIMQIIISSELYIIKTTKFYH